MMKDKPNNQIISDVIYNFTQPGTENFVCGSGCCKEASVVSITISTTIIYTCGVISYRYIIRMENQQDFFSFQIENSEM